MSTAFFSSHRKKHSSSGLRGTWQRAVDAQSSNEFTGWVVFVRRAAEKPQALYYRSVSGALSERLQLAPTPRTVMPIPLQSLLECDPDFIGEAGAKALQWLEKQEVEHRELFLRRLARVLEAEIRQAQSVSQNIIASVEVLARYRASAPEMLSLLRLLLQERPVGENHMYMVSLCRDIASRGSEHAATLADLVESVLDAQVQSGIDPSVEWQTRLVVESFRVLSHLNPNHAAGPVCRWLPSFGELEITAVLEEVVKAARHDNVSVSPELCAAIGELWGRYINNPALANAPGILAKLLELRGLSGMTSEQLIEQANTSHSPAQLLYLLAMRRPPFLTREGKLSLYTEAIKQLAGSNHRVALQQVLEAVMKDPELQTKDLLDMVSHAA